MAQLRLRPDDHPLPQPQFPRSKIMSTTTVSPIVSDREWNARILAQVAAGKLSPDQAVAQLKTAPKGNGSLSCKVSQKGAVSVYGLQRMPVTLYAEQWEVKSFIASHPALSRKRG
jgi:hypothetical protein